MSVCDEIRADLISVADEKYREFNGSLIPTVDREKVIGVCVPALKNLAKKYRNHPKIGEFLSLYNRGNKRLRTGRSGGGKVFAVRR